MQWLNQVHGVEVVEAGSGTIPEADASWTNQPLMACAVLTADCLPVLFCDRAGATVAAAYAGWRGLLGGVLEATISAMPVPANELSAWLGPAIGPRAFEVGPEVREAFLARSGGARGSVTACFQASGQQEHYLADLYGLARQRLQAAGLAHIAGGDYCTFSEGDRFFSYRRDGQTGRMATLISINRA